MGRYLWRQMAGRLVQAPLLFLLTVAGVAVGVASVVTVQLLNQSAVAAFQETLEVTTGSADVVVRPYGPSLLARVLRDVLGTEGVTAAAPVQEVSVRIGDGEGAGPSSHMEILGVDLLGQAGGGGGLLRGAEADPRALDVMISASGLAVTTAAARAFGVGPGDTLVVGHGSRIHPLPVVMTWEDDQIRGVMDLAWSQERFGATLTRLNVQGDASTRPPVLAEALGTRLGAGVRVTTLVEEGLEAGSLLSAFRLNLTALSLISVFVGAFLVYGTTRATLVRRRPELGVLRSLGATRSQVLGLILAEVAFLGLAGVAIGFPLGYLAARGNVDAVSGTLTNLYLLDAISRIVVPAWLILMSVAVGVGAALAGGILPALETAATRTRALLTSEAYDLRGTLTPGRLAAGGTLAAAAGLAAAWLPTLPHGGMVAAFLLVVAMPLFAPLVIRIVAAPLRPARLGLSYAVRSLTHRLASAGVAVAGLAVAVAMMVGITVMVASFRGSLSTWIEATVQADVYVSAAAWRGDRDAPGLSPDIQAALARVPGLMAADRVRGFSGRAAGRAVSLRGVDLALEGTPERFHVLAGTPPTGAELDGETPGRVIVSEPLARKAGLAPGDVLELETPTGTVYPVVAAVVRDYGSERGAVTMDLARMAAWFGPGEPHGAALYLEDGTDAPAVVQSLRAELAEHGLTIRPNRALRDNALRVFDQTFRITTVLQAMALLIAAVGVTLTLFVLGHDEAGTLALYRALGASRRQVFDFFVAKGMAIAVLGLLLGAVCGGALAAVLIHVVNPAYFGWSLDVHVPLGTLLRQSLWILLAAALAAVPPALMASRPRSRALNPVEA